MRRLRGIDPRILDWLFALGLGLGSVAEALTTDARIGPAWANAALLSLVGVAAFVRRRAPLIAIGLWMLVALAAAAFLTSPADLAVPFFGLLLFPWAVGVHADGKRSVAGISAALVTVVVVAIDNEDQFVLGDILFPGSFATIFWAAGRAVRSRGQLTAELHEAAQRAHEQREAEAVRAVAEERRRIAREMHDIVAHSVSTMVIQAGGARRILARDPQRAIEAAQLIERTGRAALVEMRQLLGVLHAGDEPHAGLAPQPSLRGLDALVERARAAGQAVTLRIEGERRELPAGIDLAAYRVVQEALTNVLKHAGGAPAEVLVAYAEDELRLVVGDRGLGGAGARVEGGGHGLVGMRERVRVCGGELAAVPLPGGGFEVRARLPLQDEDEAALAAAVAGEAA